MKKNVAIFGDTRGVKQLLQFIPPNHVSAIICASKRPQYIEELSAIALNLQVPILIQPEASNLKFAYFISRLKQLNIELGIINSYSMILNREVRENISRLVNFHPSYLPRNRGANPIQWAIINGETEIGVTLHEIDGGIDTGPIIDQSKIQICFDDTWLDVSDKVQKTTKSLIKKI